MGRFFAGVAFSIAALLIMVIAAVIAISYFSYALYLFLTLHMNPPAAALSTGVIILLIAALLAGITLLVGRQPRRRRPRESRESTAELGGELGRTFASLLERNKKASMAAALVAGFAVGLSPRLRQFLLDVLKK